MNNRRLVIATALLALPIYTKANAWELRPRTEIPIGGYTSAINRTTNRLYTAAGLEIRAYDLTNHEILPPISTHGGSHGTLTINEISNTIFFSDEEGTWMIDGETHELSWFTHNGSSFSFLRTQVDRRANTMYALYTAEDISGDHVRLYIEAYEADTLGFIASRFWWDKTGASFAVDERTNQILVHLAGESRITIVDGTTLDTLDTFADGILRGPEVVQFLPFDPAARRLYAYSRLDDDDGVAVIDVDAQAVISTVDITSVREVVVDKYRRCAYVTCLDDPQLYRIDRDGELAGSVLLSKEGATTGVPAVHWLTGSVYVGILDEDYRGIAVVHRGRVIQTVNLDTLINHVYAPDGSRRVYAVGQPTTSWELLLTWFAHPGIGSTEFETAVEEIAWH